MNNEIINALNVLKLGGTVLYPTDTIWGIGCDALSDIAVERIFQIKNRDYSKSLICLASSFEMIKEYVSILRSSDASEIILKISRFKEFSLSLIHI